LADGSWFGKAASSSVAQPATKKIAPKQIARTNGFMPEYEIVSSFRAKGIRNARLLPYGEEASPYGKK